MWGKLGFNKLQRISFTHVTDKEIKVNNLELIDTEVKGLVLLKEEDKLNLPKYHQQLATLDIDYSNYFLIYVTLTENSRPGSDIEIEEIIQHPANDEVVIKVRSYTTKNQFGLEIIDIPCDIVQVNKEQLDFSCNLQFKFVNHQKEVVDRIQL
ncbi:hypothetical protein [Halanaerobaculum tunisiense]